MLGQGTLAATAGARIPHIALPHVCLEGPTWADRLIPAAVWHAIAFGDDVFIAGGGYNPGGGTAACISISVDKGQNWGPLLAPFVFAGNSPVLVKCLAFNPAIHTFLAFGNFTQGALSSDKGETWEGVTDPGFEKTYLTVIEATGKFACLSTGTDKIHLSSDGRNWTDVTLPSNSTWECCAFDGLNGVIVAGDGTTAITVDGGEHWVAGTVPMNAHYDMAYGNGVVVLPLNANSTHVLYSLDNGANWLVSNALTSSRTYRTIIFRQEVFILGSDDGDVVNISPDGVDWTLGPPISNIGSVTAWEITSDGKGKYAGVATGSVSPTAAVVGACLG